MRIAGYINFCYHHFDSYATRKVFKAQVTLVHSGQSNRKPSDTVGPFELIGRDVISTQALDLSKPCAVTQRAYLYLHYLVSPLSLVIQAEQLLFWIELYTIL